MSDQTEADITETEDTEGHGFRGIVQPAGETDDTEGHHIGTGHIQPAGEPDDAEGNVAGTKH
jgi:hypothetical protein